MMSCGKGGKVYAPDNPYRMCLKRPVEFDMVSLERQFEFRYGTRPEVFQEILSSFDFSRPGDIYHPLLEEASQIDGCLSVDSVEDICVWD